VQEKRERESERARERESERARERESERARERESERDTIPKPVGLGMASANSESERASDINRTVSNVVRSLFESVHLVQSSTPNRSRESDLKRPAAAVRSDLMFILLESSPDNAAYV
jgi:hypothetical protein